MIRYFKGAYATGYAKIFPVSTLRRFIADQIIGWFTFLAYYGSIISTIASVSIIVLHFIGIIMIKYLEPNTKPTDPVTRYIGETCFGIIGLMVILVIVGLIFGIVMFICDCDYFYWSEGQAKYITELRDGREDVEAVHIPVTINAYQRLSYKILPLGSIPRYIVWSLIRLTVVIIIIKLHIYISLLILPWKDEKVPWLIKLLVSSCIQIFIGIILFGIYSCVEPSCSSDWKRFKLQQESATSHKD